MSTNSTRQYGAFSSQGKPPPTLFASTNYNYNHNHTHHHHQHLSPYTYYGPGAYQHPWYNQYDSASQPQSSQPQSQTYLFMCNNVDGGCQAACENSQIAKAHYGSHQCDRCKGVLVPWLQQRSQTPPPTSAAMAAFLSPSSSSSSSSSSSKPSSSTSSSSSSTHSDSSTESDYFDYIRSRYAPRGPAEAPLTASHGRSVPTDAFDGAIAFAAAVASDLDINRQCMNDCVVLYKKGMFLDDEVLLFKIMKSCKIIYSKVLGPQHLFHVETHKAQSLEVQFVCCL
jgi:hypothetical protein